MNQSASEILKKHGLRTTAFRTEVLNLFLKTRKNALVRSDIEGQLDGSDRITLYRTLKSFEKSGIIHQAIDGTNETKYALCHDNCTTHSHDDNHAHFLCNLCNTTTCLENVFSPELTLPINYQLEKVHVALSGTCPDCV